MPDPSCCSINRSLSRLDCGVRHGRVLGRSSNLSWSTSRDEGDSSFRRWCRGRDGLDSRGGSLPNRCFRRHSSCLRVGSSILCLDRWGRLRFFRGRPGGYLPWPSAAQLGQMVMCSAPCSFCITAAVSPPLSAERSQGCRIGWGHRRWLEDPRVGLRSPELPSRLVKCTRMPGVQLLSCNHLEAVTPVTGIIPAVGHKNGCMVPWQQRQNHEQV